MQLTLLVHFYCVHVLKTKVIIDSTELSVYAGKEGRKEGEEEEKRG